MSLSTFESSVKLIEAPQQKVYDMLSDLNNLEKAKDQMPSDKLKFIGRLAMFRRDVARTSDTYDTYYSASSGLRGLWEISSNDHLDLSYSFDQYDKANDYKRTKRLIRHYSNVQNSFRGVYSHNWSRGDILTLGADYMHDHLKNKNLGDKKFSQNIFDAFAQYDWLISPQWELVGALRYDHFSDTDNSRFTPKVSVRYQPKGFPSHRGDGSGKGSLSLRFGYGMGFRAPSLKERYYNFDMANIWIVQGNPNLKAETSHNFTASADYTTGHYNFTLSAYYNDVRNKIATGVVHTPLEEHLEEGAQYAADSEGMVNLHFTVSPEHKKEFEKLLATKLPIMEGVWGVKYNVTMSEQRASTNTIAVNTDNTPYRDENGELLFRPAGHGALIENLNERDADVIFIKNIDNVVPSKLRNVTTRYKRVLAGYLVTVQKKVAEYLNALEAKTVDADGLKEMLSFVESVLCTKCDETATMDNDALANYLHGKLNRPIRVCGMVRNEGEPGGGPYLTYNADGSYSPQILEAAQIDENDEQAVALMKSGTHFNPVDLVCYIKDYKGEKFNLKQYVDYNMGLISLKSKNGVEIKALELPGLWNGSMSDWNTIFIEVPAETFNPVKTVNDLLRKQHQ